MHSVTLSVWLHHFDCVCVMLCWWDCVYTTKVVCVPKAARPWDCIQHCVFWWNCVILCAVGMLCVTVIVCAHVLCCVSGDYVRMSLVLCIWALLCMVGLCV